MAINRSILETYRQNHFIEARLERLNGFYGSAFAIGCTALTAYGIDFAIESDRLVGSTMATGGAMLAGFGHQFAQGSFRRSERKYDLVRAIDQELTPPDGNSIDQ